MKRSAGMGLFPPSGGHWGLLVLAAIVLLSGISPNSVSAVENEEALARIANGYLENRNAFPFFYSEFSVAVGRAASLEEALEEGPTIQLLTAQCRWAVKGENISYNREIDAKALAAMEESLANPSIVTHAGQRQAFAEIPLDALGLLTDGTRMLRYDPNFVANLMGPNRIDELIEGLSPILTPWALGGMGKTLTSNLGRWILEGKYGPYQYEGEEELDGRKCLVVSSEASGSKKRYYFDPEQGFLPILKTIEYQSGERFVNRIESAIEYPGPRWFPSRIVSVRVSAGGDVKKVTEIVVGKVDPVTVPSEDLFQVVIKKGTEVNHVDDLRSAFRLTETEVVKLSDLEQLHNRCQQRLEKREQEALDRRSQ